MKGLRSYLTQALMAVAVLALAASPLSAQALLPNTTTTAAVTNTQTIFPLTSVTGITANQMYGWLDHELVEIGTVDTASLTVVVARGRQGTSARAHPTSSKFLFALRSSYAWQVVDPDIKAACGPILQWINMRTGTIFTCQLTLVWRGNNILPVTFDSISLTR